MQAMNRLAILLMTGTCLLATTTAVADILRCGSVLVESGASAAFVLPNKFPAVLRIVDGAVESITFEKNHG